jgi:hypothetical protein
VIQEGGYDAYFAALLGASAAAGALLLPMMNLRSWAQRQQDREARRQAAAPDALPEVQAQEAPRQEQLHQQPQRQLEGQR